MSSELAAPLDRLGSRPVTAAVLAALTISFTGVLVRLANVEPATAAVFRCVYALPVLWLLARVEERRFGPRAAGQRRLEAVHLHPACFQQRPDSVVDIAHRSQERRPAGAREEEADRTGHRCDSRANWPDWISARIFFISFLVSSVMMRGPRV